MKYSSNPKASRTCSEAHKAKISAAMIGKICTEETKAKIRAAWTPEKKVKLSAAMTGKPRREETKVKMSEANSGENNPMYGKIHTEETRAKMSLALIGRTLTEEHKAKMSAAKTGKNNPNYGKTFIHTKTAKAKMSIARIGKYTGESASNWQGGKSFEPYCPRFNNQLKESIRNRDNRTCVLCGESEIQNGRRLAVHHIDGDKMQGCGDKPWYLCALCNSCNSKSDTVEKEFLIVSNLQVLKH